jgi:putative ABC transport system permease protein
MSIIARRLEQQYPDSNRDWGVRLQGMQELSVQAGTTSLPRLLMTAVGLLLLTACANIANLLLARGVERRKEIALRVALGAGRLRVVRQLMVENAMFALLGAIGGLLIGYWLIAVLSWAAVSILQESGLPKFEMDGRVLLFALGVSGLTALLFGIVPAVRGARVDLNSTLKEGGTGNSAGAAKRRLSGMLVVSQVTLSLVLLISAGITLKSIYDLYQFNWGFPLDNRLSMGISLSSKTYDAAEKRLQFFRALIDEVRGMPGMQSAALVSALPVGLAPGTARVKLPATADGKPMDAAFRVVSADYMRALGIPLRKGRAFAETDSARSMPVALVNERMARKFWSESDPIGSRIEVNGVPRTIVGVIGDVVNQGLLQKPGYEVCIPFTQSTPAAMTLVIHAGGDPLSLVSPVRRVVERLDPDQPVFDVRTLRAVHERLCAPLGFVLLLLSIFAVVAVTLAGTGIYGITAHSVSARTREIGIRIAMGAGRDRVVSQVLRQGAKLAAAGIAVGAVATFLMSRLVLSKIWWLGRTGPELIGAVALLLGLVALAACYVPARRATRIDPAMALRAE